MSRKVKAIVGVVAAVVAAVLVFGVFEVQSAFIDAEVDEPLAADGEVLFEGAFHDVAHAVKGTAKIHVGIDGKRSLQLVDFRVDNGPDLEMWLVALGDAGKRDDKKVKASEHLVLGPLKGNVGDQMYALPEAYDPDKHRAAVVWCRRFGVNFATAPLRAAN